MNCLASIASAQQATQPSWSLCGRHHPTQLPGQPPNSKCLVSWCPEPSALAPPPSSLLLEFANTPLGLCLLCSLPFLRGCTRVSEQESRLCIASWAPTLWTPTCLHVTVWHLSNTVPLSSCLGAHLTHIEIVMVAIGFVPQERGGFARVSGFSRVSQGPALLRGRC